MKFLHSADWHLAPDGVSAHERQLERDTLCWALPELLIQEQIPLLVVAGDILQRSETASLEALELLEEALELYCRACGVQVILSAGNHDANLRLSPRTLALPGLHFTALGDLSLRPVRFQDAGGPILFYSLPYLFLPQLHMQGYQGMSDAYHCLLTSLGEPADRRVLVAHCLALTGRADDWRTERYRTSGEKVFAGAFAAFDYVALGHLHSTEAVTGNIRYAPCPIPRGRAAEDGTVSLVELGRGDAYVENRRLSGLWKENIHALSL